MARSYGFAQVDVFSSAPYLGNPVAVVLDADGLDAEGLDADGLDDATLQRIARWTNLSETTFLMPPTDERADYRVRIFTPARELPFAGHPTLGSAHAWLEHGGRPRTEGRIVQECAAGLVEVRQDEGALSFAAPPTLRDGDLEPDYLAQVIAALGVRPDQVIAHQWADNGPGWAVLEVASAREVLDLDPDFARIPDAMVGVIGAYPAGSRHAYEMRTFAPGVRVAEDPVCGSMNASVGQWLTRTGAVTGPYTVSQGTKLGRAGEITVTPDADGTVWVGGATTTLFRGTALI